MGHSDKMASKIYILRSMTKLRCRVFSKLEGLSLMQIRLFSGESSSYFVPILDNLDRPGILQLILLGSLRVTCFCTGRNKTRRQTRSLEPF